MCEPTTIALVATAVVGAVSAKASYDQGQTAKKVGRNNQIMAEYAAQDAIRRGEDEAVRVRQRAAQIKGAQRSSMAAKGLDLNAGTAGELQDQTDFFGQQDVTTARGNAQRNAWASRASGDAKRAEGDAAAEQGNLAAFSTLLSTTGQVSSKWGQYKKGG